MKKLVNGKLRLDLIVDREVITEEAIGPIIIKANISSHRDTFVSVYGPTGGIITAKGDEIWLGLTLDEQVLLAVDDSSIIELETAEEGLDVFKRKLLNELSYYLDQMLKLNGDT